MIMELDVIGDVRGAAETDLDMFRSILSGMMC